MKLRDAAPADLARINVLNEAALPWVSPFSVTQFAPFIEAAPYFRVVVVDDKIAGFLLALDPRSTYDSDNFRWFCERYDDFIYIDRVVVTEAWTARGVGTLLYADVERFAAARAPRLACEVNLRPRNSRSLAFHRKRGFVEVGRRDIDGGAKVLTMLIKAL
jgi:predicted GNAT superfamily acetyltransferase